MKRLVAVMIGGLTCGLAGPARAVEVLDEGYIVEHYSAYVAPGNQSPKHMAFDGIGNLYVTYTYGSQVWKITPEGEASLFLSGFQPCGVDYGGGTVWGDYLYLIRGGAWDGALYRVDAAGDVTTVTSWGTPYHGPGPLKLDRYGHFGGHMFVATSSQDRTCCIPYGGSISTFVYFPGWYDGGGPADIVFTPDGPYGGLMYMPVAYVGENEPRSGIFAISPEADVRRCSEEIVRAFRADFDRTGQFYGELFLMGQRSFDEETYRIFRMAPDGSATAFAESTPANGYINSMIFGPDGALYVAEWDRATTYISRVAVPEPATLSLLAFGGLALIRRKMRITQTDRSCAPAGGAVDSWSR